MITLKIDNKEVEANLLEFKKLEKRKLEDIAIEAIKQFFFSLKKDKLNFKKKDVTKHMHIIEKNIDTEQSDDVVLEHIEDSAKYIHNLRRQRNI